MPRPNQGLSSAHLFMALRCEPLWHIWPLFRPNVSRSCCDMFLRQSALNLRIYLWWIFVEQTMTCRHPCSNDHRCLHHDLGQCLISFVSGLLCNSEVSGKSSFGTEFRPWSNLIPKYVTSKNTPEILLSCKIRTCISGISFFFWRRFLICLPCGRTPLGTQRWTTAAILANFRPNQMEKDIHCLFFDCPPPLIRIVLREFQMVASFLDLSYPQSIEHQSNFLPRSTRTHEKTFAPNWCTRPWSFATTG